MRFSVADDLADNLIAPVVKPFNIDFGKFYSNFYKVFMDAEGPFRGLDLTLKLQIIHWLPIVIMLPHQLWYQVF